MTESMAKKYEVELFYGQSNIGVIGSVSVAGGAGTDTITIAAAEWASGIFCGGKGMKIDVRNAGDSSLIQTLTIKSVDFSTKTITVEEDTAVGVVAGCLLKPNGAHGKQAAGLVKIMSNTGSLFDIDAASYELWAGNIVNIGGAITFSKLVKAIVKAAEKGLDKDVVAVVSLSSWDDLMQDQAALANSTRRHVSEYSSKKAENGFESLVFHTVTGKIEVVASSYCKEGYGFIFSPEEMARIGATDITFSLPGMPDQFLLQSANNAGYEMRCYLNAGLFCKSIGKTVLLTGITHS
jgi:hypothetical protein